MKDRRLGKSTPKRHVIQRNQGAQKGATHLPCDQRSRVKFIENGLKVFRE